MARIANPKTEKVDLHFEAVTLRDPKKPGAHIDCVFVLEMDADEARTDTLPAELAKASALAHAALDGGPSAKVELCPEEEGKLVLEVLVNDAAEAVFEGPATVRKVKVTATGRYLKLAWYVRVYVASRAKALPFVEAWKSTVRMQFVPAQGVLPLPPEEDGKPRRPKGKAAQGGQSDDIPAVM